MREHHKSSWSEYGENDLIGKNVLIHDEIIQRLKWKLGVITDVFRGSDCIVRSVQLRVSKGITNRPISKLYPLKVKSSTS